MSVLGEILGDYGDLGDDELGAVLKRIRSSHLGRRGDRLDQRTDRVRSRYDRLNEDVQSDQINQLMAKVDAQAQKIDYLQKEAAKAGQLAGTGFRQALSLTANNLASDFVSQVFTATASQNLVVNGMSITGVGGNILLSSIQLGQNQLIDGSGGIIINTATIFKLSFTAELNVPISQQLRVVAQGVDPAGGTANRGFAVVLFADRQMGG